MGLLSLLCILPATGAVAVALVGRTRAWARGSAVVFSAATLLAALALWTKLDVSRGELALIESLPWIPGVGVSLILGCDAVSLFLVLVTAVLTLFSVLWSPGTGRFGEGAFLSSLFVLETAAVGAFLAVDVVVFTFSWLLALVTIVLLVGLWGGEGRRGVSSLRVVFGMGGNLLMLLVLLVCHHIHFIQTGAPSFDARHWVGLVLAPAAETRLFWGLVLAIAVQTPLVPLLGGSSRAVQSAPPAVQVLLCAIWVKLGAYGLFRFAVPWFPRAAWTYGPAVLTLSVAVLLLGAVAAWFSRDPAKLAARLTLSHVGLVVFGLFSFTTPGAKAALLLALSHGFYVGALLFCSAALRDRLVSSATARMERALVALVALSAGGIPLVLGFAILRQTMDPHPILSISAGVGLVVSAAGILRWARRALPRTLSGARARRPWRREILVVTSLVLLALWTGIIPGRILASLEPAAEVFLARVSEPVGLME